MRTESEQRDYKGTLYVFAFLTAVFLFYAGVHNVSIYYHDANYYWTIADGMFADGSFDLYGFPETFRGYVFPFVCQIIKILAKPVIGSEVWGFRVFSSVLSAAVFAVFLPGIFHWRADSLAKAIRNCLVSIPVLYFWGDLLQYPLSDMPAFGFACGGLYLLSVCLNNKGHRWSFALSGIGAGALFYAAYNTRVVYQYGIIFALLLYGFFFGVRHPEKRRRLIITGALVVAGGTLISLPQMLINYHWTGSASPRVFTEQLFGYQQNLQMSQVFWGITYPRYETYVGDNFVFPKAGVLYSDTIGADILAREGLSVVYFSLIAWLKLLLKYPLDMLGIYTRHMVSLLTNVFPEVYIHELYQSKAIRIGLSICGWLLGGLGLTEVSLCNYKMKWENIVPPVVCLILPAAMQLLGAPEIRFFLPVHFLLYFFVACEMHYTGIWQMIRSHLFPVLLPCIVVTFAWLSVLGSLLSECDERLQIIHDQPVELVPVSEVIVADKLEISDSKSALAAVNLGEQLRGETIKPRSDTLYEISFDLDCGETPPQLLYFDFYGTEYDNAAQDFQFELEPGKHSYKKVRASGQVSEDAMVRLIYITEHPYVLENFRLSVVEGKR